MDEHTIRPDQALPIEPEAGARYRVLPRVDLPEAEYAARTDRNIGWIDAEQQSALRRAVIGIAGCGGMGGLLAITFARLGVGEIRIADAERFEPTNLNRQTAAYRRTLGHSKAMETARLMREIADDVMIQIYPEGISEASARSFTEGCDLILDEVDFWAIGARVTLHHAAATARVPIMVGSSIGFGTRLLIFDDTCPTLERIIGLTVRDARALERRCAIGGNDEGEARDRIAHVMLTWMVPELPEYGAYGNATGNCLERLQTESIASIIATNPPLAAGFVANHALLLLLEHACGTPSPVRLPRAPGYAYFDAALMRCYSVERSLDEVA